MPAGPGEILDTSPRGLLRLYFSLVMCAAAAVLLLHGTMGFVSGFGKHFGPYVLGLDALLLLLAYVGYELSSVPDDTRLPKPRLGLLVLVGIFTVIVCSETGGLASPFFMIVLATAIFAALTMSPRAAVLLTAVLAALHVAGVWLRPDEGLLLGGVDGMLDVVRSGRDMGQQQMTALCLHTLFMFLAMAMSLRLSKQFRQRVESLTQDANRDPLTNLPNRRGFTDKMRQEIRRAERYAWPISMLVVDLDHFKQVNDQHGHAFGDAVLAQASRLLQDAVGAVDHLARVGGEEFAVAAVAAEPSHGAELAQHILRRFREHPWHQMKTGLTVTCSIGVAVLDPSRTSIDPRTTLSALLDQADQALYLVKQSGRDDFLVHGEEKIQSTTTMRLPKPAPQPKRDAGPARDAAAQDDASPSTTRKMYRSPRHQPRG